MDTPYSGSNAYHPFNLIVDSAGTAHIPYVYVAKQNGRTSDERYRKGGGARHGPGVEPGRDSRRGPGHRRAVAVGGAEH